MSLHHPSATPTPGMVTVTLPSSGSAWAEEEAAAAEEEDTRRLSRCVSSRFPHGLLSSGSVGLCPSVTSSRTRVESGGTALAFPGLVTARGALQH